MKLLATLSVAIALVTGLTFASLAMKTAGQASAPSSSAAMVARSSNVSSQGFAPPADLSTGDTNVTASVKIGNPDDVTASVIIK